MVMNDRVFSREPWLQRNNQRRESTFLLAGNNIWKDIERSVIFQLEDTGEQQRGKNKRASEHTRACLSN